MVWRRSKFKFASYTASAGLSPPFPSTLRTQLEAKLTSRRLWRLVLPAFVLILAIHFLYVVEHIRLLDSSFWTHFTDRSVQAGEQLVRVNQDTRLNNRVLDIRTPANQGIFCIQSQVGNVRTLLRCCVICASLIWPVGVLWVWTEDFQLLFAGLWVVMLRLVVVLWLA